MIDIIPFKFNYSPHEIAAKINEMIISINGMEMDIWESMGEKHKSDEILAAIHEQCKELNKFYKLQEEDEEE